MKRIWIVAPLALLALILVGLVVLGLPPGTATQAPYEKAIVVPGAQDAAR